VGLWFVLFRVVDLTWFVVDLFVTGCFGCCLFLFMVALIVSYCWCLSWALLI